MGNAKTLSGILRDDESIDWPSFCAGAVFALVVAWGIYIEYGGPVCAGKADPPEQAPTRKALRFESVMPAGTDADGDPRHVYSFESDVPGHPALDYLLSDYQASLLRGMSRSGYAMLPSGGARAGRSHRAASSLSDQGLATFGAQAEAEDPWPYRLDLSGSGRAVAEALSDPQVKLAIARSRAKKTHEFSESYFMDGIERPKSLPHRRPLAIGKLREYLEQLVRLHELIRAGELESEAAEQLMDEMDETGKHLDDREVAIAQEVSAMLHRIDELDLVDLIKRH